MLEIHNDAKPIHDNDSANPDKVLFIRALLYSI